MDQRILTASKSVTITRLLAWLFSLVYCSSCVLLDAFLPISLRHRWHFRQLTRLIKPTRTLLHRLLLPVRQLLLYLLMRGRPRHNVKVALSTAERGPFHLKESICRQSELLLFSIVGLLLWPRSAISTF